MAAQSDARFERHVLDRGLADEEDLRQARRLIAQARQEGHQLTLPDALIQAGALTANQVRRAMAALKEETASPAIQIPGIELLEKIGRGSQAVVYKGRQVSVDRPVAVKIPLSEAARDPDARRRFIQEARAAAKLSHNNIVQAIDAGEADGHYYFVQEFIDGTTLHELLKARGGPLEEQRALRIVIQVAEALAHAHSRGLIHGDVKPRNIMLTREGVAKLADMGFARHASDAAGQDDHPGKAFGTPYYIAPERVLGSLRPDFRADIYSLGATFYEMLAGRPPFMAPTPQQVMQKHVSGRLLPPDHVNPNLSAGVGEVVEVMLAKRPQDRYASTEDLLADLRAVAAGLPPRIAREKAGPRPDLLENLARGEQVRPQAPPRPPGPFAVNTLTIILIVALAAAILLLVLQAVM